MTTAMDCRQSVAAAETGASGQVPKEFLADHEQILEVCYGIVAVKNNIRISVGKKECK